MHGKEQHNSRNTAKLSRVLSDHNRGKIIGRSMSIFQIKNESSFQGGACETIELVNAVNNIDPSLQVNGGVACHYQVYGTTVPSAYGEEVCVQSLPVSQCVMGPSTGGHENGG